MKKLLLTAFSAGALLLSDHSASATSYNVIQDLLGVGDFPANNIGDVTGNPGLGDANVLAFLQGIVGPTYDLNDDFPDPTTAQSDYTGGPIAAGDYLVLHYGVGNGGTQGSGGGLVVLYFDADEASFDVPADGSGPNGCGGLSFARLYDHVPSVPDGGMSLVSLSLALLGLGCFGRFKNKA
jgi:hypothetical protein